MHWMECKSTWKCNAHTLSPHLSSSRWNNNGNLILCEIISFAWSVCSVHSVGIFLYLFSFSFFNLLEINKHESSRLQTLFIDKLNKDLCFIVLTAAAAVVTCYYCFFFFTPFGYMVESCCAYFLNEHFFKCIFRCEVFISLSVCGQ